MSVASRKREAERHSGKFGKAIPADKTIFRLRQALGGQLSRLAWKSKDADGNVATRVYERKTR